MKNTISDDCLFARMDFANKISSAMHRAGLSKAGLAKKIGNSKAFVTKLLSGETNLTIDTMVRVLLANNARLDAVISPVSGDEWEIKRKIDQLEKEAWGDSTADDSCWNTESVKKETIPVSKGQPKVDGGELIELIISDMEQGDYIAKAYKSEVSNGR